MHPLGDSPGGAPSRRSDRVFDRVIALQRADGSWALDEALLAVCGLPSEMLTMLEAFVGGASDEGRRAMATAIALTFLRRRAMADRMEWSLLERKAEEFLSRVAGVPNGGGTWFDVAAAAFDRTTTT